jgi:hypothetical protein
MLFLVLDTVSVSATHRKRVRGRLLRPVRMVITLLAAFHHDRMMLHGQSLNRLIVKAAELFWNR